MDLIGLLKAGEHMQKVDTTPAVKDLPAYFIGGCGIVLPHLADMAETAQQISVILGCVLVFVTLIHRVYIFWKDTR